MLWSQNRGFNKVTVYVCTHFQRIATALVLIKSTPIKYLCTCTSKYIENKPMYWFITPKNSERGFSKKRVSFLKPLHDW